MATLTASPKQQFFDANGVPLSGGKLYTYAAGTTTPIATYTDSTAGTANTNPIILNSRGECDIWLLSGTAYKYILNTSADALVWTVDNITGNISFAEKDASNGFVGLTLLKINFKNILNTFTSFFTNSNTASRTYTFPDATGNVLISSSASMTAGFNEARGSVAMHATTMDLWAQPNIIDGTGAAVTITAIANAPQAGARRILYPPAGTVITNGATFSVQGAANHTTAAGDSLEFESVTVSTFKVNITRADGNAPSIEYGSFTAGLTAGTSGTITLGVNTLRYRKEGVAGAGKVDFWGYIVVSAVSAPVGMLLLTGLPYPCRNNADSIAAVGIYPTNLSGGVGGSILGSTIANTTTVEISRFLGGIEYNDVAGYVQAGGKATTFVFCGSYAI